MRTYIDGTPAQVGSYFFINRESDTEFSPTVAELLSVNVHKHGKCDYRQHAILRIACTVGRWKKDDIIALDPTEERRVRLLCQAAFTGRAWHAITHGELLRVICITNRGVVRPDPDGVAALDFCIALC